MKDTIKNEFNAHLKNATSLHAITDVSILTLIGNDFGHEYVFSRQVEAFAN
jgi:phosphoheptose isomerase